MAEEAHSICKERSIIQENHSAEVSSRNSQSLVDSLLFFFSYIFSYSTFVSGILESVLKRIRSLLEIKITLHSINFLAYFGEYPTVAAKPKIFSTISTSPNLLWILRCFKS
ncbi:uncharacterized protein LOC122530441 [Frieseomelitta varia]|uniref:uncharacterized protein LOC122530441 n=1 Tax=Frieseomelitta varia TaxID=561572 RepID=UPI001CB67A42|nr:uncharacterized protein LOC122530441 [Frieseomelitta varia]